MTQPKVRVTKDVLEGLDAVKRSGKTNMLDVTCVIGILLKMGFIDSAFWVYDNHSMYVKGIFSGFESERDGGTCTDN